jgi:type II secretory pathway pseudopilin PulG
MSIDVSRDESAPVDPASDEGFGLVEIVVSMFILALLAVSFLPILIQGLKTSAANATIVTASQLSAEQLEYARIQSVTCDSVFHMNDSPTSTATDPRGVELVVTRSVAACPVSTFAYPTTVAFTVVVTRSDTGEVVASAKSLIYVKKKS